MTSHDTPGQKALKAQLIQSKRMEGTGQLAAGIAHEFNNILTAILAHAEFAAKEIRADHPSRDDLDEIRQQATKGARLVRHLLAFSRRQVLRTEVVDLGAIFQELEPLLQRLVSERVVFAIDVAPGTPSVEIDRAQIELVLLELVSNAADAMKAGGTLTVGMQPETVTASGGTAGRKPGDYVRITVRDTGVGVDPSHQSRLAEPFFTTKGDKHPGLGLAMVDGAVGQHRGLLTFESTLGKGTVVTILLPASSRPAERDDVVSPLAATGGTETILVVEDESAVRAVICRSLRARGYNILEAKNGEDALLAAEKHNAPIHLVVTDVVMPEMGGTELFQHLRRWYPTIRTLFISGYTKGSIPEEALEVGGGAGFLPKPFTLDQLASEVRRVISMPRPTAATLG